VEAVGVAVEEVLVAVEPLAGVTAQDPPLVAATETVRASEKAPAQGAASRPAPAVARR